MAALITQNRILIFYHHPCVISPVKKLGLNWGFVVLSSLNLFTWQNIPALPGSPPNLPGSLPNLPGSPPNLPAMLRGPSPQATCPSAVPNLVKFRPTDQIPPPTKSNMDRTLLY